MKIIIDIPEKKYKSIQDGYYCGILDNDLYYAIKDGIPLDDLRAKLGRCKTCHEMRLSERDIKGKLMISDIFCHIIAIIDDYTTDKAVKEWTE